MTEPAARFHGKRCPRCGGTERFVATRACTSCQHRAGRDTGDTRIPVTDEHADILQGTRAFLVGLIAAGDGDRYKDRNVLAALDIVDDALDWWDRHRDGEDA